MNIHLQTLPSLFQPATCYRLQLVLLHPSSFRGCPIEVNLLRCWGLVFSTAHLLIPIAALKYRFTNSMRLLPLLELTFGRTARTRALCTTTVSLSSRRANI